MAIDTHDDTHIIDKNDREQLKELAGDGRTILWAFVIIALIAVVVYVMDEIYRPSLMNGAEGTMSGEMNTIPNPSHVTNTAP